MKCTTWDSSRLHPRWGVWSAAAVLQLRVQELPQSAAWYQPLLLHLRAGQVLPGARWLRRVLGQTVHPCRQLLRSGGWWVTTAYCRKMKQPVFLGGFFFCILPCFIRQAVNGHLFLLKAVISNGHKSPWEIKRQQKKVISWDPVWRRSPSCVRFPAASNTPMYWASIWRNRNFNSEAKGCHPSSEYVMLPFLHPHISSLIVLAVRNETKGK